MSALPCIGLLGGTFNPIHYGHLRIAEELMQQLDLASVQFIPAATPPHKAAPSVSAQQRAAMVQLAIANHAKFELDTRELSRTGASYTIDTLMSLRAEYGENTALCLLMGTDAFAKLDTWHDWQALLDYAHIVIVTRPNSTGEQMPLPDPLQAFLKAHYTEHVSDLHHTAHGYITMQNVTALDISATRIRETIAQSGSVRYLMPDAVIAYIEACGLYRG